MAGSFVDQSDQRLKTNINDLSSANGLDAIMALHPVSFHWKDQNIDQEKGEQIGFLAQELEKVFPKLISIGIATTTAPLADGTTVTVADPKFVNYEGVIVPAVKAIQELNVKLEDLATTTEEMSEGTFPSRFFSGLFAHITQWFADAQNGIDKIFTHEIIATNGTFATLIASTTVSDTLAANQKICLGSRCMTAEQFNHILDMEAAAGPATAGSGRSAGAAGGSSASSPQAGTDSSTSTSATNDVQPAGGEPVENPVTPPEPTGEPELPAEGAAEEALAPTEDVAVPQAANDNSPTVGLPATGTE